MARIIPDHEIKKIIGSVLIGADVNLLNPNGIQLRLGEHVYFCSTDEGKKLKKGQFLKVCPGETVIISSYEKIDFSAETVKKIYPESMLMAFITPTTSIMREGISQVATKIDAGFRGVLNWSFRNSSINDFKIQHAEPIFKLTIFELGKDESPKVPYGEGEDHKYQDTDGIKLSERRIPSTIPKKSIVASSFEKLDHTKQLKEAGYPFSHIGTELVELQGKFEVVSTDVKLLKDQFDKQTKELSSKIEDETNNISIRLDEAKSNLSEKMEFIFQKKFIWTIGIIIALASVFKGICMYMEEKDIGGNISLIGGIIIAILAVAITIVLTKPKREK